MEIYSGIMCASQVAPASQWPTLGEWFVVIAEVLVAWVIYLELRHTRESTFLQKAADPLANATRRTIYERYFENFADSGNLDGVSTRFLEMVHSDEEIRKCCETQLALFNELGLVYRKALWVFSTEMVTVIPHAAIFLWVFLKDFIRQRRELTGPWFARPFRRFVLESIKFVLDQDVPMRIRPLKPFKGVTELTEHQRTLTLSPADLKKLLDELRLELRQEVRVNWRRALLTGIGWGLGTASLLALIVGGYRWYNGPKPPKPWNTRAIKAEYDRVDVEGDKNNIVFHFILENQTDFDYRVDDASSIDMTAKLLQQNGLSRFDEQEKIDYPISVPAKKRIRFAIHLQYPYSVHLKQDATPEERREFRKGLEHYLATETGNLDGFDLLDRSNRYEIEFPAGWKTATR